MKEMEDKKKGGKRKKGDDDEDDTEGASGVRKRLTKGKANRNDTRGKKKFRK